jgi:hypothetical protein
MKSYSQSWLTTNSDAIEKKDIWGYNSTVTVSKVLEQ